MMVGLFVGQCVIVYLEHHGCLGLFFHIVSVQPEMTAAKAFPKCGHQNKVHYEHKVV
jgi:hypothetical protein